MEDREPDDRKLRVLRAIIEDFVATREPVGSKAIVEGHELGVSSATIRNDMAALEEDGYIAQPHTSAGRVPTDKGYRLFVDRIGGIKPLSSAERRAIHQFLDSAMDLDDVMARTVRLLAQLTRQVAMVQYPSLTRSTVRHVELVGLTATKVLLVVIADTGRVEQRVVILPAPMSEHGLADLRTHMLTAVTGQSFTDVPSRVVELPEAFEGADRAGVSVILATLLETVVERHEERIVLGGQANLARVDTDFPRSIGPVLEALEEQMVLLRLLGETASTERLNVRIGSENEVEGFTDASVVTIGYGSKEQGVASLGIVGPTRMDYPGNMGAVQAVARYVGRILRPDE